MLINHQFWAEIGQILVVLSPFVSKYSQKFRNHGPRLLANVWGNNEGTIQWRSKWRFYVFYGWWTIDRENNVAWGMQFSSKNCPSVWALRHTKQRHIDDALLWLSRGFTIRKCILFCGYGQHICRGTGMIGYYLHHMIYWWFYSSSIIVTISKARGWIETQRCPRPAIRQLVDTVMLLIRLDLKRIKSVETGYTSTSLILCWKTMIWWQRFGSDFVPRLIEMTDAVSRSVLIWRKRIEYMTKSFKTVIFYVSKE